MKKLPANLSMPTSAELTNYNSVQELASAEGWLPDGYAATLSTNICQTGISLDHQRERLASLISIGAHADKAAAAELGRHYQILDSLFVRFAAEASQALDKGGFGSADRAGRLLHASVRAERTCIAVLGALTVLRQPQPGNRVSISRQTDLRPDNDNGNLKALE